MKFAVLFAALGWALALRSRESAVSPDFDHLRRSVVRIQATSAQFDWFHPFSSGQDAVGLGSGFAVQTEPYPLFVTNEHVINDAKSVTLQLLLYGERQWEAEVVLVCSKFDLAVLVLKHPEEFKQAMASQDIELQPLKLSDSVTRMGEDVVALGFPLGQDSLKISKGNIAGNEEVDGNICIQSTAPISPGNSGGPLLNADGSEVVGVNFAKATQGENINYVIPVWRVQQMVKEHLQKQPRAPAHGESWERHRVQVPKPELTTIESNVALHTMYGCELGIYIARVGERSLFMDASPPVAKGSFLVSVRGVKLDRFGMGINTKYAADRVEYPDLLFMAPDLSSDMEFETCSNGKTVRHTVSLAYRATFDRGIAYVDEPYQAGISKGYEVFGDISVMQMTVNHISAIVSEMGDPSPTRWLHPDLVAQPRLMITYVRSGSYAADVLSVGAAVKKLNGQEVRTLEEFRQHLAPEKGDIWTLETDTGKTCALKFQQSLQDQVQQANYGADYLLTPGILGAARKFGLMSQAAGPMGATDESLRDKMEKANREMEAAKEELERAVAEKQARAKGTNHTQAVLLQAHTHALESMYDGDFGKSGLEVRAAGPLAAEIAKPGAARTTRRGRGQGLTM